MMNDLAAIYRDGNDAISAAYQAGIVEGRSRLVGVRLERVVDVADELGRLHEKAKAEAADQNDSLYERGRAYGYSVAEQRLREALAQLGPAVAGVSNG